MSFLPETGAPAFGPPSQSEPTPDLGNVPAGPSAPTAAPTPAPLLGGAGRGGGGGGDNVRDIRFMPPPQSQATYLPQSFFRDMPRDREHYKILIKLQRKELARRTRGKSADVKRAEMFSFLGGVGRYDRSWWHKKSPAFPSRPKPQETQPKKKKRTRDDDDDDKRTRSFLDMVMPSKGFRTGTTFATTRRFTREFVGDVQAAKDSIVRRLRERRRPNELETLPENPIELGDANDFTESLLSSEPGSGTGAGTGWIDTMKAKAGFEYTFVPNRHHLTPDEHMSARYMHAHNRLSDLARQHHADTQKLIPAEGEWKQILRDMGVPEHEIEQEIRKFQMIERDANRIKFYEQKLRENGINLPRQIYDLEIAKDPKGYDYVKRVLWNSPETNRNIMTVGEAPRLGSKSMERAPLPYQDHTHINSDSVKFSSPASELEGIIGHGDGATEAMQIGKKFNLKTHVFNPRTNFHEREWGRSVGHENLEIFRHKFHEPSRHSVQTAGQGHGSLYTTEGGEVTFENEHLKNHSMDRFVQMQVKDSHALVEPEVRASRARSWFKQVHDQFHPNQATHHVTGEIFNMDRSNLTRLDNVDHSDFYSGDEWHTDSDDFFSADELDELDELDDLIMESDQNQGAVNRRTFEDLRTDRERALAEQDFHDTELEDLVPDGDDIPYEQFKDEAPHRVFNRELIEGRMQGFGFDSSGNKTDPFHSGDFRTDLDLIANRPQTLRGRFGHFTKYVPQTLRGRFRHFTKHVKQTAINKTNSLVSGARSLFSKTRSMSAELEERLLTDMHDRVTDYVLNEQRDIISEQMRGRALNRNIVLRNMYEFKQVNPSGTFSEFMQHINRGNSSSSGTFRNINGPEISSKMDFHDTMLKDWIYSDGHLTKGEWKALTHDHIEGRTPEFFSGSNDRNHDFSSGAKDLRLKVQKRMATTTPKWIDNMKRQFDERLHPEIDLIGNRIEAHAERFWKKQNKSEYLEMMDNNFNRNDYNTGFGRLRAAEIEHNIMGPFAERVFTDPVSRFHANEAIRDHPSYGQHLKRFLNPKNIGVGLGSAFLANRAVNVSEDLTGLHMAEFPKTVIEGATMGGLNWAGLTALGAESAAFAPEMAMGATFYGTKYLTSKAMDWAGISDDNSFFNEVTSDALAGAATGGLFGGFAGAAVGGALGAGFGAISKAFEALF